VDVSGELQAPSALFAVKGSLVYWYSSDEFGGVMNMYVRLSVESCKTTINAFGSCKLPSGVSASHHCVHLLVTNFPNYASLWNVTCGLPQASSCEMSSRSLKVFKTGMVLLEKVVNKMNLPGYLCIPYKEIRDGIPG
jgi:hypothetical protein